MAKTPEPPLKMTFGAPTLKSQCRDCCFGESGESSLKLKAQSAHHVLANPGHTVDEHETRHRTVTSASAS